MELSKIESLAAQLGAPKRPEPRYLYFVLAMLASIVLITATPQMSFLGVLGIVVAAATLMATAYLTAGKRRQLLVAISLGAAALLPVAWFRTHPGQVPRGLANVIYTIDLTIWLLFTLTTTLIILRRIMTVRVIRANEIYGAIYVYLLFGVLFAQGYQLLLVARPDAIYFDPGRFPVPDRLGPEIVARGPGDLVYFSFVTLGTVGYGDATPASPGARAISLIEEILGVMYVATMIARFVSISSNREGPAVLEPGTSDEEA